MFNKLISSLINRLLSKKAGSVKFQALFEDLHCLALRGMNIGQGGDLQESGEKQVLHYLKQKLNLQDTIVIFDVGANVGDYTSLLSEVFNDKASVSVFEPSLEAFRKLYANQGGKANVKCYNFGFGEVETKMFLHKDTADSGFASLYARRLEHFNIVLGLREEVQINTLDKFCKDLQIPHIHFLKLDVEGHEAEVLRGASNLLNSNSVDFIQFEFGGCDIDAKTFFQDFFYMLNDKYRIYRILRDGLYEIYEYKENYEVFLNTNYLAERKR